MAEVATNEHLSLLKGLYPTSSFDKVAEYVENPWYIVTAVAFSASNRPDAVALVFKFVMAGLSALSGSHDDKQLVVLRMREAIFKAGLISGYSRAISALIALNEVTPEEFKYKKLLREVDNDKVSDLVSRGDGLFEAMYGTTAAPVQTLLEEIHPDMGWFSKNIAYGYVYQTVGILSQRDTSYAIVAALIAMDTPRQIGWHLANCKRGGARHEEICSIRDISMRVASACGVKWRDGVPEVQADE
ncbi:uncharacterized protein FOMMEDRAFT_119842 [Fomitiporia mediterranea MF3/22]|uniref:uncharacterized protein n=1 Tax=Fomitiporia mediterranea (strain MF3/22) TaxID=694068 RepID=UPI0004407AE1|nr:uncharacterized protein FOMMEDRAFT_119842 [Fomitiporia mediterranea MF3/22]EJD06267.1 hypothetical protein FOMMEDRAFT_119842 [Fomitiporia mediterranea MF3/22]